MMCILILITKNIIYLFILFCATGSVPQHCLQDISELENEGGFWNVCDNENQKFIWDNLKKSYKDRAVKKIKEGCIAKKSQAITSFCKALDAMKDKDVIAETYETIFDYFATSEFMKLSHTEQECIFIPYISVFLEYISKSKVSETFFNKVLEQFKNYGRGDAYDSYMLTALNDFFKRMDDLNQAIPWGFIEKIPFYNNTYTTLYSCLVPIYQFPVRLDYSLQTLLNFLKEKIFDTSEELQYLVFVLKQLKPFVQNRFILGDKDSVALYMEALECVLRYSLDFQNSSSKYNSKDLLHDVMLFAMEDENSFYYDRLLILYIEELLNDKNSNDDIELLLALNEVKPSPVIDAAICLLKGENNFEKFIKIYFYNLNLEKLYVISPNFACLLFKRMASYYWKGLLLTNNIQFYCDFLKEYYVCIKKLLTLLPASEWLKSLKEISIMGRGYASFI